MNSSDSGVVVLANPNAGRVTPQVVDRLCQVISCRGAETEVAVTRHQAEVEPVLDRLDGRRLVVAGGDGTLHDAVNRLWRRRLLGAPVAFVPLGTANALARGVGVPLDVAAAGRVALEGRARDLDLIMGDDGSVVVNDVHTGVGVAQPEAVAAAKRIIGRFAYPVVNAWTALHGDGWRLSVEVDGRTLIDGEQVLAVAVGNSPVIGNDTRLWPRARPDDGEADVVVFRAVRRVDRIMLGVAVARSAHESHDSVVTGRGRTIRIEGGPGAHNADGEMWPGVHARTYRVVPRAWRLLVG